MLAGSVNGRVKNYKRGLVQVLIRILVLNLILFVPILSYVQASDDDDLEEIECLWPTVVATDDRTGEEYCLDMSNLDQYVIIIIFPPTIEISPYFAGICSRPLDGMPFRFGVFRHDDAVTYEKHTDQRSNENTSGFYPVSMPEAIAAAFLHLSSGYSEWVQGKHIHTNHSDPNCTLTSVNKDYYDWVYNRSVTVVWYLYSLLNGNCQHWANTVVNGT